jgi:carboxypeptidase family protein
MYRMARVIAVLVFTAGSTFARDNGLVIKGNVMDDDGKPADGTAVRVKALDRKAPDKVVRTDSRGHYIILGLAPGKYSVTAYDLFGNARSRALIKSERTGWARVNFDLALDSMVGDDATTAKGQVRVISGHAFGSPR